MSPRGQKWKHMTCPRWARTKALDDLLSPTSARGRWPWLGLASKRGTSMMKRMKAHSIHSKETILPDTLLGGQKPWCSCKWELDLRPPGSPVAHWRNAGSAGLLGSGLRSWGVHVVFSAAALFIVLTVRMLLYGSAYPFLFYRYVTDVTFGC